MNTVYVTGLPADVRVQKVSELFLKECGKVKYSDFLPADELCIAVRFDDPGAFEKAVRRTDLQLDGAAGPLKIAIKPPPGAQRAQNKGKGKGGWQDNGGKGKGDQQAGGGKQGQDRKGDGKGKGGNASIWIGNLPSGVSEEKVNKEFERFGTIRSTVIRGGPDRRSVFAYVNFTEPSAAEKAIEKMNKSTAFGDPLNVSYSRNPPRAPVDGDWQATEQEAEDGDKPKKRIELRPGPGAKKGADEAESAANADRSDGKVADSSKPAEASSRPDRREESDGKAAAHSSKPAEASSRGDRRDGRVDERHRDRRDNRDYRDRPRDRDRDRDYDRERERQRDRERDRERERERARDRDRDRDRERGRTRRDAASRSRSRGRRSASRDRRGSRRESTRDDGPREEESRKRARSGEAKDSRQRAADVAMAASTKKQDEDEDEDETGEEDASDDDEAVDNGKKGSDDDESEEEPEPKRGKSLKASPPKKAPETTKKSAPKDAPAPPKKESKKSSQPSKKLLKIENLPPDMTNEELRTTAADFGTVLSSEVSDTVAGGGRVAKVTYERQEDLELALKKLDRRRVEGWEKRLQATIVEER